MDDSAHIADWIFCLTRTSDTGKKQEGITFLLIPMKQEGIEVKPIITLGGSHSVNMVHLTDVKVPVENRVGEEGKGWGYAKGLLAHERTGLAGISKSLVALDTLRLQAGSVKRGNATLLDDPAYKSKLAELEIDLFGHRVHRTALTGKCRERRRTRTGVVNFKAQGDGNSAAHSKTHRRGWWHLFLPRGARSQWATVSPRAVCPAILPAAPIRFMAVLQRCKKTW